MVDPLVMATQKPLRTYFNTWIEQRCVYDSYAPSTKRNNSSNKHQTMSEKNLCTASAPIQTPYICWMLYYVFILALVERKWMSHLLKQTNKQANRLWTHTRYWMNVSSGWAECTWITWFVGEKKPQVSIFFLRANIFAVHVSTQEVYEH